MSKNTNTPTDASIIITYRCPMKCKMCNIWANPTRVEDEITSDELKKLPRLRFINITGGEPFIREDLFDIVEILFTKAQRIVVSTSGWFQERVIKLAKKYPNIGIRISIEGLSQSNDELRGCSGGFDKGLRTLLELKRMGLKDIGFGQTISNNNSHDILPLYELSRNLGMEFATAAFHNSFYFHKDDNVITNKTEVLENIEELILRLLREKNPKSWFRAFFNLGLINYIQGNKRMLPCEAGMVNFFVEPNGDVYPCNGLEVKYWKESMGNIKEVNQFNQIWLSPKAEKIRKLVSTCPKNCWMVGTVAPVIRKYIRYPITWIFKEKLRVLLRGKPCYDLPYYYVGQDLRQGDGVWPRE